MRQLEAWWDCGWEWMGEGGGGREGSDRALSLRVRRACVCGGGWVGGD